MLKSGIALLFGTVTQIIIVIISFSFYLRYAMIHGGIGASNTLNAAPPLIWFLIVVELIISAILIWFGIKNEIGK